MSTSRPTRIALALLVLLLAALAGWWLSDAPAQPERRSDTEEDSLAQASRAPPPTPKRGRSRHAPPPADAESTAEAPEEPAAPDADLTTWSVLVLDGQDRPLPGARVDLVQPGKGGARYAGPDGVAELGAFDAGVAVEIDPRYLGLPKRTLEEPRTVLRVLDALPLEVDVVDAQTGRAIPGTAPMTVSLRASAAEVLVPLQRNGDRFGLDATELGPGRFSGLTLHVVPPPGYALAYGPTIWAGGGISRYTERVRVTIPLRPVASVAVVVLEPGGEAAVDVSVDAVVVGATKVPHEAARADGKGRIVVSGLPYLQGERTQVLVSKDGRHALARDLVWTSFGQTPECRVSLPQELNSPPGLPQPMGFGMGGASSGFSSRRSGKATLEVTVRRRNGRVAADTRVRIDRRTEKLTDSAGQVHFEKLWAGDHTLEVREPGFTWVSTKVKTDGEGEHSVEILEPPGRDLEVRVLDAAGLPVGYARVHVRHLDGPADAEVVDGVQHLQRFTDAGGLCMLRHMPATMLHIDAELGNRYAKVTVRNGDPAVVELRLREKK